MYNATTDFANAATHNSSPGISQSKKQIFFPCFLHFRGTFLPLCWCVCRHLFPIFPSPQSQIDTSLLLQSWYQCTIPALTIHPLARSLTHTHILSLQANEWVIFSPSPPLHPYPLAGEHHSKRPRALHSPIWILLGKLAPNTAPRKLVQKKAKMCCIFPFALAKKKPSSKHRFDFSPALLSLAASLASPPRRLQGCASPSLGIQRRVCCWAAPGSRINWAPGERKRARSSSTSLPRHTQHAHAHTSRFHPARSPSPSGSSNNWGYHVAPAPRLAPAFPHGGPRLGVSKGNSHLPLNSRVFPSTALGRSLKEPVNQ